MTHKNGENFQTSLNLQQTYLAALGSHINNIYHKISEIQQQLPHPTQHMNTGDVIQIDALEFDPDIDGGPPMKEHGEIQGSDSPIQHLLGESFGSPCFTTTSCRRSGLAGCCTSRDPATISPG